MRGARNLSIEHLNKIREQISKLNIKKSIEVEVFYNERGTKVKYTSIRLTARELNCNDGTVKNYLDSNKLFLGRYILSSTKNKNDEDK